VTTAQTVMEDPDAAELELKFHVACFHVWDVERQTSRRESAGRLPARSGFGAPGARPGRPWAPGAPPARPTRVTSR
jgi:hypothetical protein